MKRICPKTKRQASGKHDGIQSKSIPGTGNRKSKPLEVERTLAYSMNREDNGMIDNLEKKIFRERDNTSSIFSDSYLLAKTLKEILENCLVYKRKKHLRHMFIMLE